MMKLDKINDCFVCSNYNNSTRCCEHPDVNRRDPVYGAVIPNWCPLDNAEVDE